MAGKLEKFSKKYGFFTSDASNEEIVAISKELSDVMYDHTKQLSRNSIFVIGLAIVAVIGGLFVLSYFPIPAGSYKSILMILRIFAILLFAVAGIGSFLALSSAEKGASYTPMMWRNVRETASDEKVYEQMLATKKINKNIYSSRSYLTSSSLLLILGIFLMSIAFVLQVFIENGYLS